MEALETIRTILELSQKGAEHSSEVRQLRVTVKSLQKTLWELESVKLDPEQEELLRSQLTEAKTLLAKPKSRGLWASIKNMFPGSELSQIKELIEKLIKTSTLLSLYVSTANIKGLQSQKKKQKQKRKRSDYTRTSSGPTAVEDAKRSKREAEARKDRDAVLINVPNATLDMETLDVLNLDEAKLLVPSKVVFTLDFEGDQELDAIALVSGLEHVAVYSDSYVYSFDRAKFMDFPKDIVIRISKVHALITVVHNPLKDPTTSHLLQLPHPQLEKRDTRSTEGSDRCSGSSKGGEDKETGLGTVPDCAELIPVETSMQVFIEDQSTNGTYVNGKRLPKKVKQQLRSDDLIAIVLGLQHQVLVAFRFRIHIHIPS